MTPEMKFLRPAPGLKVRREDPSQGYVPEDGEDLPLSTYYARRLDEGSLVEGPADDPKPKQKGKT